MPIFINNDPVYDVVELVKAINHPVVNTKYKMFKFLRATGVLEGMNSNPLLRKRGIVWDETWDLTRGSWTKKFQKVLFSSKGKRWVAELLDHYYFDEDESTVVLQKPAPTIRRSWNPFAQHPRR